MKINHNFDFDGVTRQLKLDYYCQVKVVNYIRRQVSLSTVSRPTTFTYSLVGVGKGRRTKRMDQKQINKHNIEYSY